MGGELLWSESYAELKKNNPKEKKKQKNPNKLNKIPQVITISDWIVYNLEETFAFKGWEFKLFLSIIPV